jgi:hypothetical protein
MGSSSQDGLDMNHAITKKRASDDYVMQKRIIGDGIFSDAYA